MEKKQHFEVKLWEKVFKLVNNPNDEESFSKLLYHYTTPTGLLGILSNQHIWATEATFLNDLYEIRYGLDITKNILHKVAQTKDIYTKNFCELSLNYLSHMNSKEEEIYITSFSENSDLLSQWKGYSGFGEGFAIGLDFSDIINSKENSKIGHISIKKVIYNKKIQKNIIKSKLEFMLKKSKELIVLKENEKEEDIIKASAKALAYFLNEQSKRFKSSEFSEEKEWRAIYINHNFSNQKRIKNSFRMAGNTITPYIELNFSSSKAIKPRLPIKKIIIGPKIDSKKAAKSINLLYKNMDCHIPKIRKSKISLQ